MNKRKPHSTAQYRTHSKIVTQYKRLLGGFSPYQPHPHNQEGQAAEEPVNEQRRILHRVWLREEKMEDFVVGDGADHISFIAIVLDETLSVTCSLLFSFAAT
jgi:hypothetical protein